MPRNKSKRKVNQKTGIMADNENLKDELLNSDIALRKGEIKKSSTFPLVDSVTQTTDNTENLAAQYKKQVERLEREQVL